MGNHQGHRPLLLRLTQGCDSLGPIFQPHEGNENNKGHVSQKKKRQVGGKWKEAAWRSQGTPHTSQEASIKKGMHHVVSRRHI